MVRALAGDDPWPSVMMHGPGLTGDTPVLETV